MAATDRNDARASFSNANADVEIAAAGVDVLSTKRGGGYVAFSGTSMATPHVAGVAALIAAKNPSFSASADPLQARHVRRRPRRRGPRPAVRLRPREPGQGPFLKRARHLYLANPGTRDARPPGRSGGLHAALRPGVGFGARTCGRRGVVDHERVHVRRRAGRARGGRRRGLLSLGAGAGTTVRAPRPARARHAAVPRARRGRRALPVAAGAAGRRVVAASPASAAADRARRAPA